jgi:hypothetical protein
MTRVRPLVVLTLVAGSAFIALSAWVAVAGVIPGEEALRSTMVPRCPRPRSPSCAPSTTLAIGRFSSDDGGDHPRARTEMTGLVVLRVVGRVGDRVVLVGRSSS